METNFDSYMKGFKFKSYNRAVLANDKILHREYQDALDHGEGMCNRLRVLIVGEKGVGKSSLLQMLTGGCCDPTIEPNSTEGIEISICETSDLSPEWRESKGGQTQADDPKLSAAWCVCKNKESTSGALRNRAGDNKGGVNWQSSAKRRGGLRGRYGKREPENPDQVIGIVDKMKDASKVLGMQLKWSLVLIILISFRWLDIVGGGFGPFVWTAVLSLRLFLDTTTAYRFGTVCSLVLSMQAVLGHTVYNIIVGGNEFGLSYKALSGICMVVYCVLTSGFIGFLSGFGSRTGMAVAFCLMSYNRQNESENGNQDGLFNFLLCVGILIGIVVVRQTGNFIKTLLLTPHFTRYILILATGVLLMIVIPHISFPFGCYFTLVFVGFLLGFSVTKGALLGRELERNRDILQNAYLRYLCKKGIGFIFAITFGQLIGWGIPNTIEWSQWISAILFIVRDMYVCWQVYTYHQAGIPIDTLRNQQLISSKGLDGAVMKLVVWDFAGDSIYQFMQHFFLPRKAVYILAFNLELARDNLNQQTEQLRKWLFTIKAHSDAFDALVFVVGTHLDNVKGDEGFLKHVSKQLKGELYTDFCNILAINAESDNPLFVVENSRYIDDDGVLLRESIKRLSKERPFAQQIQPVSYLRFLQYVKRFQTERNPWFINRNDLMEEAGRNGFNAEEVLNFLRYGHLSGEFIYRDDDDVMQQFVILEPQYLIDLMKELLKFPPLSERQLENAEHWQTLQSQGVASLDLLAEIVDENEQLLYIIVRFLEAYNMLLPIRYAVGGRFQQCIVPSHLPDHNPDQCWDSSPDDEEYFFDFGYVPCEAIFYRLIARCWYHHQSEAQMDATLYSRCGIFSFEVKENDIFFMVEFQMKSINQQLIRVVVQSFVGDQRSGVQVLRWVTSQLEDIRKNDFPNLPYKFGPSCKECSSDQMVKVLKVCGNGEEFNPTANSPPKKFLRDGRYHEVYIAPKLHVSCGSKNRRSYSESSGTSATGDNDTDQEWLPGNIEVAEGSKEVTVIQAGNNTCISLGQRRTRVPYQQRQEQPSHFVPAIEDNERN